ncbi:hypothetical protein PFICI_05878 [Pestalotiopsis fici W106-1]|uniref:Uncharacterized protein n=1 Tax=Pestalotiopsis fici (strain W106-1 / CGMCC3.15140) TaxID=1229662 RepID=W3XF02_PESFW|nr:uncharacterized protein PFICI_05878 [Pestalotiopsis fici W106-1]ETS84002.1 hypothetical protein PFICI_05878 [Pestalotiopsis fici W106-1]
MEQPGYPAPTDNISDTLPQQANTTPPGNHTHFPGPPIRAATTSSSVPSLRFPRPAGNRRLTNWVSSSHPDMMRPFNIPDNHPLDASITDGYDIIDADVEGHSDVADSPYEHPASEIGDDVQSLADTDTGTDVYTNDVDTDSSDDDIMDIEHAGDAADDSAAETDEEEDNEADMSMAEQSLEHPTELFTPDSAHISRRTSFSQHDNADMVRDRKMRVSGFFKHHGTDHAGPSDGNGFLAIPSARNLAHMAVDHLENNPLLRKRLLYSLLLMPLLITGAIIKEYMQGNVSAYTGTLTTVPVASVSSIATQPIPNVVATTAMTTPMTASTKSQPNALQTTSTLKSVASVSPQSNLYSSPSLCSASVHGRNEILLRVPKEIKASWLAKRALMISVSRGTHDVSSDAARITTVDEGFLIKVPHEEAYGVLDVSIATTRKPKIKETFRVNFGTFIIVDAFDAGKQFLKDFAHSVADTLNGTTTWVEETCSPAFDMMPASASITDSIVQGFQDMANSALSLPGHFAEFVKSPLSFSESRVEQAQKELWRTAQDLQDEAALLILQAQLNSKLQWLRWSGQDAKYEQYLAAASPYYQKKQEEAAVASRARAELTKKEIRALHKQMARESDREAKPRFWRFNMEAV